MASMSDPAAQWPPASDSGLTADGGMGTACVMAGAARSTAASTAEHMRHPRDACIQRTRERDDARCVVRPSGLGRRSSLNMAPRYREEHRDRIGPSRILVSVSAPGACRQMSYTDGVMTDRDGARHYSPASGRGPSPPQHCGHHAPGNLGAEIKSSRSPRIRRRAIRLAGRRMSV
jgi:hypothetical protein